ncbi:MAG: biotin--[acetyl-CoA-carboxylase] ligase [Eubacterium sp.]|nr:biotin--[acetyl-CoA-carboxylase] ligase [Eubacterium sp.]NBI86741.1 biotin--[acetyl-CoA-carboxylase] ligase [Lachnospiraceae bacterium]
MKTELLAALRSAEGFVSGQELCDKFGVSRTAVWKSIQKLKAEGYQIEAVPNKGYCLTGVADILNKEELENLRNTEWTGNKVVYFEVTDSTNIQAKRLGEEGWPHGTLVVAGRQEAGRGRRGRTWESPGHTGVFMTVLLRPSFLPGQASMLTIVAAMAVTKAVRVKYGLDVQIKWPNDIVLNGRKICGILTEMNTEIDAINYVVIGIGINVSNERFGDDTAKVATSLRIEGGGEIRRAELIWAVWEAFEAYYGNFIKTGDLQGIKHEYDGYLVNIDRQVRVLDQKEPFTGTARGITAHGELIVETDEGIKRVSSGEVSVRGIFGYV